VSTQLGEISKDGRYRWDGHEWQLLNPESAPPAPPIVATAAPAQVHAPTVQRVEMRAGAAFRMGFFAFFGAGCASIAFWLVIVIGIAALGAAGIGIGALGTLGSHT